MRAAVNAVALWSTVLVLSLVPAAPTAAQGDAAVTGSGQAGADRWLPSLAVVSGVLIQDWNGSVVSEICRGCTIPDSMMREEPLRVPTDGDDVAVTPFVGGGLELMTPELPIRTSPRLFVGGDVVAAFGVERQVASEGDPGTIASPANSPTTPFSEDVALGQGSETIAEIGSVAYGAHAGVAFPFELAGRPVRLKPSFAWIRYEVEVQGLVVDAQCRPFLGTTRCNTATGFLREIRLQASGDDTFDGIGGGLDLEMDTGRFGPIGSSIFVGGRFYRILGDRKIQLQDTQSFDDTLGMDTTQARFDFEMDEWIYRVGVGLRLHWLGFDP